MDEPTTNLDAANVRGLAEAHLFWMMLEAMFASRVLVFDGFHFRLSPRSLKPEEHSLVFSWFS